jgi:hypothetical protein
LVMNLAKTRLRMTYWYYCSDQYGPKFTAGDEVMIAHCNVQRKWPMNKVYHKTFGPFNVKKGVGRKTFEFEFLMQPLIHPFFHVAILEPYKAPTDSQIIVDPPETEKIDGVVNFVVRKVVDSRVDRKEKKRKYLLL